MNSFWKDAYNDEKDRRYGRLFFITLLIALPLAGIFAALGANLNSYQLQELCIIALPVIILTIIVLCWRWIHFERKNRKDRLKYAAMSRDELAKARSKLKSQMKPVKSTKQIRACEKRVGERRVASPKPDTYLKY